MPEASPPTAGQPLAFAFMVRGLATESRIGGFDRDPITRLTGSQIHHMHIGPKPGVVCEVPAGMIGILVNHDGVAIPEPAINIAKLVWEYAEKVTVKPEPIAVPALEPENMAGSKTAAKASMFPRMIKVEASIIRSRIVPDPFTVRLDVGRVRMPGSVGKVAICRRGAPGSGSGIMLLRAKRGK